MSNPLPVTDSGRPGKDRSVPFRLAACGVLQAAFFLEIHHQLGRWIRRDTNVYFCFAAFALALLSVTVIFPILSGISQVSRVFIRVIGLLPIGEWLVAARILFHQL